MAAMYICSYEIACDEWLVHCKGAGGRGKQKDHFFLNLPGIHFVFFADVAKW